MHIHFRELFCRLFALWRAVFPDCTWSTALETCGAKGPRPEYGITGYIEISRVNRQVFKHKYVHKSGHVASIQRMGPLAGSSLK